MTGSVVTLQDDRHWQGGVDGVKIAQAVIEVWQWQQKRAGLVWKLHQAAVKRIPTGSDMPFVALEKLHRLHDGYRRSFALEGRNLLLFQHDGQIYLIENDCPHAGARFDHGTIRHGAIHCPWHGMAFNLATGETASCGLRLVKYDPQYQDASVGIVID